MYQTFSIIAKYTNIIQKSSSLPSNWKTPTVSKKEDQQNLKRILKFYSNSCGIEKWFFNLPDSSVPQGPAYGESYQYYSRNSQIVHATENIKNL